MCENFYRVINKKVYKNSFHQKNSSIPLCPKLNSSSSADLPSVKICIQFCKKQKKQKQEEAVRAPKTVKTRKQKRHQIYNNINHAFVISGAAGAVN